MSIPTAVLMKLATIGLSPEQAEAVAGMLSSVEEATAAECNAALEESRTKARNRVQKWREKKACNVTERNETSRNGLCGGITPVDVKQITIDTPNEEKEDTGAAKPLSDVAQFKAELAPILDKDRIEALCAVRRKKKATFSAHAGKLLVGKINRCPDVAVAADAMILGNWTSVEPEWLQGRQKSAAQSQAPPHETAYARHQRECREAIQQELNGNRGHDEFTSGPAFDLEKRDYRAH